MIQWYNTMSLYNVGGRNQLQQCLAMKDVELLSCQEGHKDDDDDHHHDDPDDPITLTSDYSLNRQSPQCIIKAVIIITILIIMILISGPAYQLGQE